MNCLKQKSLVAAGQELYTESLKKQLTIQAEINRIQKGGDITFKQRIATFARGDIFNEGDRINQVIKNLNDELEESGTKTNAVFKGLNENSRKLTELFEAPQDKIHSLIASLDNFILKSSGFSQAFANMITSSQKAQQSLYPEKTIDKPFDKEVFDKQKATADANS